MGKIPQGRILVSMDEAEMTREGIILPAGRAQSNIGTIIQSGIRLAPEGSKVALNTDNISMVTIKGKEYASVREDAILMITK